MRFINTDGMAFIGPGSEWFWTALQFTALTLTFIALYRQFHAQQRQLEENEKLLRSQAHYNALLLVQRPWELMITNERLAGIVNMGSTTPEMLSDDDWTVCMSYLFMQFNGWEYFYYQHQDGSIPKQLWAGADAVFKDLIATKPGLSRFWSEAAAGFDEPFRTYVATEFVKRLKSAAPAASAPAAPTRTRPTTETETGLVPPTP